MAKRLCFMSCILDIPLYKDDLTALLRIVDLPAKDKFAMTPHRDDVTFLWLKARRQGHLPIHQEVSLRYQLL